MTPDHAVQHPLAYRAGPPAVPPLKSETWTMLRQRQARGLLAALTLILAVVFAGLQAPTAAAAPCQTCDPGGPTLPGGPTARYEIRQSAATYNNLYCLFPEDHTGDDSIYLKINGNRVGLGTVSIGGGEAKHFVFNYIFYTAPTQNPSFYISMFDDDWPDADDKLGGHQVTSGPWPSAAHRNSSCT